MDAEPVPSECPKKLAPGIHCNSAHQVRGLDAQGFQIGCHSMTHPYLSDLTEPELKREVADAKLQHAYDRLRAVLLGNPASKP